MLFGGVNMRIAEYKQVSTRTEQRVVNHGTEYDEEGNIIAKAWEEIVKVEVPVMGMVYRDATPEEIAEMERQQAEMPDPEQSTEERLNTLENTTDDIVLMLADIIGGEE